MDTTVQAPVVEGSGLKDTDSSALDPPEISKNQMKKLKKQQAREERRSERKEKRKELRHARQDRKRVEITAKVAEARSLGLDPNTVLTQYAKPKIKSNRVPVSIVIDTDFISYMNENEFISMSDQLTRCYSSNRKAPFRCHLVISDWKGTLKGRHDNLLGGQYKKWKEMLFTEADFLQACQEATAQMSQSDKEDLCDSLKPQELSSSGVLKVEPEDRLLPDPEQVKHENIVYLTADSPHTIQRLEPHTCYVVGGIVDHNREKGLCYRRAKERGVRTAKLPIGEYIQMATRKVLSINQVVEIMLKWLELNDWGEAFLSVIPKRKGVQLKQSAQLDMTENKPLHDELGESAHEMQDDAAETSAT